MPNEYSTYTVRIKNTDYLLHLCWDVLTDTCTEFWVFDPQNSTWVMIPVPEFNDALLPYGMQLSEIPA